MGIGVLCGLLAGAMWGIVFIAPAYLAAFTPLQLAVGRYLAYGVIALVLVGPRLRALTTRLRRADLYALTRHALAGNLVYYVLLAYGVQYAGVAPTSLIVGMVPLVVTLLGRHDRGAVPLRRMLAPLLLVAAGIACINLDTLTHAPVDVSGIAIAGGMLCAAGALLCWSWYALDNARYLKNNPHLGSGEWSALYGLATGVLSLVLAPLAFGNASAPETGARDWTLFWACNALLALGASVIGNHFWNVASRRVPVTLTGQLILFETLFALLYGCLYRGAAPRPLELAAVALMIVGVAWSIRLHGDFKDDELTSPRQDLD
ncbi:drug/metabolite transporter (DMT)-like permease [Massilia sp. MP_M2]|uniref:DMT family transporter n=1 Tax=Massilia sp. MP_M2 TaxID=3071713 RepID=UPI00319E119F